VAANPDDRLREESLILDSVDRFLERDVRPHAHALEAADAYPSEIVEKLKAFGLFGAVIAPEYGGLGLSALTYARIVERVSAVWMSVAVGAVLSTARFATTEVALLPALSSATARKS